MKVEQGLWTIQTLIDQKDSINLSPAWQRGPAWRENRRVLLIDSILRNMDVPKIYLRKLPAGGLHAYEAVDGQQRLQAIWDFASKKSDVHKGRGFTLKSSDALPPIHGITVADRTFTTLSRTLRDRFLAFQVGVGEIVESTNDEIAILFARLQMGMPLNPAELRNADLGQMRNIIQLMTKSHEFFTYTKIRDDRTKHFDYASYAFAVAATGVTHDLKAPDLRDFQREYNAKPMEDITALSARVGEALNVLGEVDQRTKYNITRKWIFVDLLALILQYQDAGKAIDIAKFTTRYDAFEKRRRDYTSKQDILLNSRRADSKSTDRALYDYLFAFRTEGAKAASLSTRRRSLAKFFPDVEVK
ncbi:MULTISPECIES: DUF262 domain-containing protein [unclassified Sphingomonas]|uniref:DUF262 domain-containing protein n=1 Tax=unclassified Sphingomonas TaxID=196159 RepID=UPI002269C31F|nr:MULTISPECIES: DUF262 domain-containing protein [unclassified Sphingomonas]